MVLIFHSKWLDVCAWLLLKLMHGADVCWMQKESFKLKRFCTDKTVCKYMRVSGERNTWTHHQSSHSRSSGSHRSWDRSSLNPLATRRSFSANHKRPQALWENTEHASNTQSNWILVQKYLPQNVLLNSKMTQIRSALKLERKLYISWVCATVLTKMMRANFTKSSPSSQGDYRLFPEWDNPSSCDTNHFFRITGIRTTSFMAYKNSVLF